MKIKRDYLEEIIKKSVFKTLNENSFDDDISLLIPDNNNVGDYDYTNDTNTVNSNGTNAVTTANPYDQRIKDLEEFYNTNLFKSDGAENNQTRRTKIRYFLGGFRKRFNVSSFKNADIKPWEISNDTLRIDPNGFNPKVGLRNFFNAFDNDEEMVKQYRIFQKNLGKAKKAAAQNTSNVGEKEKTLKATKDTTIPTKQVQYDIQMKGDKRFCVYREENGKPVMNYKFPKMAVFKVYITKSGMKKLKQAYDDIERIWQDVDDYTLYDCYNKDNNYQRQDTGSLGGRILNLKKFTTRGKHPLTGEDVITVDEYGNTIYVDKDTGEVIPYGNKDVFAKYWEESLRQKREKYGTGRRTKGVKKDNDNTRTDVGDISEGTGSKRPMPLYPDENGEYTLEVPRNGVDMFEPYNDTEEFFATYPVRDENNNLTHFYVIGNENLDSKQMLQHLHAIVTRSYQKPLMSLQNASDNYAVRWTPVYHEDSETLCFAKHINSEKTTPLDVIPEEDIKEMFVDDWTKYYGNIAMQHNDDVEATYKVIVRNQNVGHLGGLNYVSKGSANESLLVKMINESLKKYLRF
jgi:hypothetical protein